jgi:hypothetical protein
MVVKTTDTETTMATTTTVDERGRFGEGSGGSHRVGDRVTEGSGGSRRSGKIVAARGQGREAEYRIHWQGQASADPLWTAHSYLN